MGIMMARNFKKYLVESTSTEEQDFNDDSRRNSILLEHMKGLGYKFLGAGAFKAAFVNPKTHNVKIIQHDESYRETANFKKWVSFCFQHSSNPHLPNISFSKPLTISGEKFIVVNIERLFEISSELSQIREAIHELMKACTSAIGSTSILQKDLKSKVVADAKARLEASGDITESMVLLVLSVEDFDFLLGTLIDIINATPSSGFLDLHSGNFMIASDGTLVITDPWASF
jgi:hypothetical protein